MGQTSKGWLHGVRSLTPSARRAFDPDIRDLDLEPISFLVAFEQFWPLPKVDAVEFEYRCFLQLVRDHPGEAIAPSRDCDLYWHAHILTLELYLQHCRRLFGKPLLHYPFSGSLGPEDLVLQQERFARCRALFEDLMSRVPRTRPVSVVLPAPRGPRESGLPGRAIFPRRRPSGARRQTV